MQLQSHALNDLLIRELGSLAVLAEVNLDFIPHIRPQKDLRLPAAFGDFLASAAFEELTSKISAQAQEIMGADMVDPKAEMRALSPADVSPLYKEKYWDKVKGDELPAGVDYVVFEQEYMANPAENASNPFGSSYIKQCTFEVSHEAPIAFGIDLAKSVDFTVIIGLDKNGSVCYFDRFQKDWRQTKQVINNLPKIPMLIDSTGAANEVGAAMAIKNRRGARIVCHGLQNGEGLG